MALEKTTQNNLIEVFKRMGYERIGPRIKLLGTSPKLDDNFKKQIERLNKNVLQGTELSETEFERLRNEYPKNHADAFIKLRNGVNIMLDNNKRVSLRFIDNVNIDNNVFQITDELRVVALKENRLDLVILINGIPIVNIEMKKTGSGNKGVSEAVSQINRYSHNGIYQQDLLKFIQMFVATNGTATKYFSVDTRAEQGQDYGEFAFNWMNKDNKIVSKLEDFSHEFFEPKNFIKVLFYYMLMKPSPNQQIMIMRPYQIHALQAILSTVNKGLDVNTFISASTGSGKTLTSFKTSELLAAQGKKVIILLDRNDLAEQTTREFNTFDSTGLITGFVDKGKDLHNALNNIEQKLVITTMQSFNNWIENSDNSSVVKELSNSKNVVIMVDECHRSTSAEMFANIKNAFYNKRTKILQCNLVGFTGTPLLAENAKTIREMTQHIFGEVAHIYTITEAIRDNSVLPFKVFNFEVNSGLSEEQLRKYTGAEYFGHPARILANASAIVHQFKRYTLQNDAVKTPLTEGFVAMLAADNKSMAVSYWKALREKFKEENRKVAIVFSLEDNKELPGHENVDGSTVFETEKYAEIVKAYDEDYGTNFSKAYKDDKTSGREKHVRDVIDRSKKGEIDLLIVSDMLLTGYDNKFLNTIYLDKSISSAHTYLQAISRTNRICGEKKRTGNIVLFSDRGDDTMLKNTIKLFGTSENIEEILDFKTFKEMKQILRKNVFDFRNLIPLPESVDEIDDVNALKEVIKSYREVQRTFSNIRMYPEWEDDLGYKEVGLNVDEMELYYDHIQLAKSRLIVNDPDGDDGLKDDPDFTIATIDGEVIGYNYILKLLNNFVASPPEEKDRWLRHCEKVVHNLSDDDMSDQKVVFERVLDSVRAGEINTVDELLEALEREKSYEQQLLREKFANRFDIPLNVVDYIREFNDDSRSLSELELGRELKKRNVKSDLNMIKRTEFAKELLQAFKETFVEEK